jgi:arsenate reductase
MTMPVRPVILFACVHNGGRSLAGKVLTQHYANGAVDVRSAGSEPGDSLNPVVVEVLHERGLSTEGETPTLLTRDGVVEADIVITMGCGEACPYVPGKRIVDWELEDPKGKDLGTVRRIVEEIDERVLALLEELDIAVPA